MFDKHWMWNGSCPCGYESRWYSSVLVARIVAYSHAFVYRHWWGNLTIAARGRRRSDTLRYKVGLTRAFLMRKKRKHFSLKRFIKYAFRNFGVISKSEERAG